MFLNTSEAAPGDPENEIIELSLAGSPVRRFAGFTIRLSLVLSLSEAAARPA